jgi:hypothetical protein
MTITSEQFAKHIAGFTVSGCTVRRRNFLYLLLREDYTQWTDYKEEGEYPSERHLEKRVVPILLHKESPWSSGAIKGFDLATIGSCVRPEEKVVVATLDGQVYGTGGGASGLEPEIPRSEDGRRSGMQRLKTIDGQLYVCGGNRTFGLRLGVGEWRWFSGLFDFPAPKSPGSILRQPSGFEDVDGFAANDIYLVGGEGDVWHFDGNKAGRIDFPSNMHLHSVCCGGDGNVYVAGSEGALFVGRGDKWRALETPRLSLPLMYMAWHDGQLWATNDYGVWTVEDGRLVDAKVPASAKVASGYLSAADGVLLLAGRYGAAYHQDSKWTQLFSYQTMMERCRSEGKLDGVLRARWHEFSTGYKDDDGDE